MIDNNQLSRIVELLNTYREGDLVTAMSIVELTGSIIDKTEGELKKILKDINNYFTETMKLGSPASVIEDVENFKKAIEEHLDTTKETQTMSNSNIQNENNVTINKDEIDVPTTFINESLEHLQGIEQKILKLESDFNLDLVNSIFRPVHTIKGTAGYFGFNKIKTLSHTLETLLDNLRNEKIEVTSELIDILLESTDLLNKMIENLQSTVYDIPEGENITIEESDESIEELVEKIKNYSTEQQTQNTPEQGEEIIWDIKELREDLKNNFIEEAYDHFDNIESILLAIEEKRAGIDKYDDLFRSLHSLKGNSRLLLSTLSLPENKIQKHILNYFQEISHLAEAIIHKRRDTGSFLTEEEHDILLDTVDTLKSITKYIETGEKEEITPIELIKALKEIQKSKEHNTTTQKTIEKQTNQPDAKAFSFSNTMTQSVQMIQIAIDNLKEGINKNKSLDMLTRAFNNISKLGKSVNHTLLTEESEKAFKLIEDISKGIDEKQKVKRLEEILSTIAERGDRRQAATVKEQIKKITTKETTKPTTQFIKIPEHQLSTLMNLVMELVVIKNNFMEVAKEIRNTGSIDEIKDDIKTISQNISKVTYDLQNSVMQMRMVPVGTIFSRFPRLVRDLSKAMNKKIKLEISGEDTKLDKTIIDALADPLVHIIRNSVDHGIDTPEQRIKNGKPEIGTISLSAYNQGQNVIIEIKDDGRGIDPNKIKKKALEKGLIEEEKLSHYTEKELLNLIFLPGFSTAEKVTDVSGRGVGMDVVKTNIEKLSGSIELDSIVGVGTTIRLKLPLTLAITKGLEITVANDNYYVPIDYVLESVKVPFKNIKKYRDTRIVFIRGEILPLYSLKELLGYGKEKEIPDKEEIVKIVVLVVKGKKVALWVDEFTRESEFVIKPIPSTVGNIDSFSGLTITGKGKIILVIDPLKIF